MRVPKGIKLIRAERRVEIAWPIGEEGGDEIQSIGARQLRCSCRCASCVDEVTGRKILDDAIVPEDIAIDGAEAIGAYALKFRFSDGHQDGLFTYEHLDGLRGAQETS